MAADPKDHEARAPARDDDDAPSSSAVPSSSALPSSAERAAGPSSAPGDEAPASTPGDEPAPSSRQLERRPPLEQTMAAMHHLFPKRPAHLTPPPSSKPPPKPPATPPTPTTPATPPREDDSITVMGNDDDDDSGLVGLGPQGTMIVPLSATPSGRGRSLPIPKKGDRIGGEDGRRFEIVERLGAGGMAVVLLAKDTVLDRTVAIKFVTHEVLGAAGAEVVERFKLEARASARLSHENIVRTFDLGTSNSVPFLVMEHLEGRPLDSIEMHHELDALRSVRVMADVARGLSHAHKSGIVHRDLKPSNVFILKDGRAKIVDFGLASIAFGLDSRGTEWLALAGTPRYMSPEQWKGEPQDGRTDIWAAGVMLFEMLVGRPPFPGESIFEVRNRVLSPEPAMPVRKLRPDLPEEAGRLVERALAKDPAKRLPTADDMLDGLVALEVALNRATRAATQDAQTRGESKAQPERRQATFLSCSLANLMLLAEQLELDDFSELLDGFFEVCATVVRQLDGTVLASLGGRVVACFGYPNAHEDDAQRALRASFLISGAIKSWTRKDGTPHAAQIGIHTSLAIAASIRDAKEGATPILQGEAPHVAMWLEAEARPNEILMSQRAQTLVRGLFETEPAGERTPEGATREIETHRALRPASDATRFDHGAAESLTPLVGRDSETKELRALWDRVKRGEGQFVMLAGEAGIGKSRLVESLREHIVAQPHQLVGCQSWLHFKNTALYPIATGMMRVLGLTPEMPAVDQIHRLEVFLSELGITLDEHVPLLASLFSIPVSGGYVLPALSPDLLKGKVLEAIITTMLQLARREPTLLLIEDLHWSDTSTIELLGMLQGRMQSAPLMLLLTFRPDFTPPWPERTHLHRIALHRLSTSQTAAMAAFASQGRNLPREVIDHLVRRTDGIPLFVEELTRIVADAWEQAERSGESLSFESFAAKTIPATLSELLLARLDRLADNGKEVAQVGAVLGREFSYGLIQRTCPLAESALHGGLMQLVEGGIIRHEGQGDDARYVFKHAMIQEAAYQSLLKSHRQEHHLRAAQVLVEHFPEAAAQHPELVGHHFAEAGHADDAVGYFEKAGQRAVQRFANADAVIHYSSAIEQLKTLPVGPARDRRELMLQLAIGSPLMATKGTAAPQVRETYARARELCQLGGDDAQLFPAMRGLTQFYMVAGEPKIAVELGQQLLAQAERLGEATMQMLAHRSLGQSIWLLGQFNTCREHNEKVLAMYDSEQHKKLAFTTGQDPGVWSGSNLAWCLWYLGFPDQAVRRAEEAVKLARTIEHPVSIALSTNYLAIIHNYRGEHELALDLADRAMHTCTEHKLTLWMSMSKIQRGWALLGKGDPSTGMEQLREGVAGWTKTGAKSALTFFMSLLIWGLWKAGKHDEAMHTIEEAQALVIAMGETWLEAELHRLRGEVTLALHPSEEAAAEECFRRGLDVARRQQSRALELRNAISIGRFLRRQGRAEEAKNILTPVLGWFEEGTETADLREARELAGLLQSGARSV